MDSKIKEELISELINRFKYTKEVAEEILKNNYKGAWKSKNHYIYAWFGLLDMEITRKELEDFICCEKFVQNLFSRNDCFSIQTSDYMTHVFNT